MSGQSRQLRKRKQKTRNKYYHFCSCQLDVAIYPSGACVTQPVVSWSAAISTSSPLNFLPSTCCFSWFAASHFPSHTSHQQVFFPICSAQQLLDDQPLPLPPQVKLHLHIATPDYGGQIDTLTISTYPNNITALHICILCCKSPWCATRQAKPLVPFNNVYKSWGNVDSRGDDLTLRYYQVCDAGGGRKRGGSRPICLP